MKKRLTKKYGKYGRPYCFNCEEEVRFSNAIVKDALYKLGRIEDLEEQIGCPLEVIVEAQVSGFYGKLKEEEFCFYNPVEDFIVIDFRLGRIQVALSMDFYNVITFYLTDHKKTWWLKKEGNTNG